MILCSTWESTGSTLAVGNRAVLSSWRHTDELFGRTSCSEGISRDRRRVASSLGRCGLVGGWPESSFLSKGIQFPRKRYRRTYHLLRYADRRSVAWSICEMQLPIVASPPIIDIDNLRRARPAYPMQVHMRT